MNACRLMLAALALVAIAAGPATAADSPTGAARAIGPDALGFIHIRVADIWASDASAQFRQFTAQAGVDLIGAIEKRLTPPPSAIESVTVVVTNVEFQEPLPAGRPTDVTPLWIVTTKKPYDRVELLKAMGKTRKHANTGPSVTSSRMRTGRAFT